MLEPLRGPAVALVGISPLPSEIEKIKMLDVSLRDDVFAVEVLYRCWPAVCCPAW